MTVSLDVYGELAQAVAKQSQLGRTDVVTREGLVDIIGAFGVYLDGKIEAEVGYLRESEGLSPRQRAELVANATDACMDYALDAFDLDFFRRLYTYNDGRSSLEGEYIPQDETPSERRNRVLRALESRRLPLPLPGETA